MAYVVIVWETENDKKLQRSLVETMKSTNVIVRDGVALFKLKGTTYEGHDSYHSSN